MQVHGSATVFDRCAHRSCNEDSHMHAYTVTPLDRANILKTLGSFTA